jgi:hypothetical protein
MPSLDHRVIVAGVIGLGFGALVAAAPSRDAERYGAPAVEPAEIQLTALMAASASQPLEDVKMLGLETDPESFDRAGLESWWTRYRQKHPTR